MPMFLQRTLKWRDAKYQLIIRNKAWIFFSVVVLVVYNANKFISAFLLAAAASHCQ